MEEAVTGMGREGERAGREREEIERQRESKWALACQGPWLDLKFWWRNTGRDWGTVQRVRWVEGINTPSSHYFCLLIFSWWPSTRDQDARKCIDVILTQRSASWGQRVGWRRVESRSGEQKTMSSPVRSSCLSLPTLLLYSGKHSCPSTGARVPSIPGTDVINLVIVPAENENVSSHQCSSYKVMRMWGRKGKNKQFI